MDFTPPKLKSPPTVEQTQQLPPEIFETGGKSGATSIPTFLSTAAFAELQKQFAVQQAMLEQQTAMMAERDAALTNLLKQNQVLAEINEELNRKVDSKSTADAKPDASTTTPKKAEKLELPSYTGAKYNGTPADFTT